MRCTPRRTPCTLVDLQGPVHSGLRHSSSRRPSLDPCDSSACGSQRVFRRGQIGRFTAVSDGIAKAEELAQSLEQLRVILPKGSPLCRLLGTYDACYKQRGAKIMNVGSGAGSTVLIYVISVMEIDFS